MRQLFVDTGAWVAAYDKGDKFHLRAITTFARLAQSTTLITTNYVLNETFTLLLVNAGHAQMVTFKQSLDRMLRTSVLKLVWVDEQLATEAWGVFEQFNRDKSWSFTDCVSYAVMKREQLTDAFMFDHHFEQMGFTLVA